MNNQPKVTDLMDAKLLVTAYYDKYTGLPNSEKLSADLGQTSFTGKEFIINVQLPLLSEFKSIYGRKAGYQLLASVGKWLGEQKYLHSGLYRGEGDMLCIFFRDSKKNQVVRIAGEIVSKLKGGWRINLEDQEMIYSYPASVSMVCLEPGFQGLDPLGLIGRAALLALRTDAISVYDDEIHRLAHENPARLTGTSKSAVHFSKQDATAELPEQFSLRRWLNRESVYEVTPDLLILLNQCIQRFVNSRNLSKAFYDVLKIAGDYFRLSGSFVLIHAEGAADHKSHIWHRYDIGGNEYMFESLNVPEIMESVIDIFREDGVLAVSEADYLPRELLKLTKSFQIQSLLLIPMWDKEELVGVVGFNDTEKRKWKAEEIVFLWNFGILVAENIIQESRPSKINENQTMLKSVLDNTGLNVYVTDIDTDELLWVNNTMRKRYGIDQSDIGKSCYQVLQGKCGRCNFCKVSQLITNPELGQPLSEYHNQKWDRHFIAYDSLIQWEYGRYAHIRYSLDITDYKHIQRRMEYFATTDAMTGAINRNTLMLTLSEQLRQVSETGRELTIGFVDADGLKLINDTYGHSAGDQLLTCIVLSLRKCIKKNDIIGRFGGDEFVVIFESCNKERAAVRMKKAEEELLSLMAATELNGKFSFSYGLAESREVAYHGNIDQYVNELLALADYRMLENKQQFRTIETQSKEKQKVV